MLPNKFKKGLFDQLHGSSPILGTLESPRSLDESGNSFTGPDNTGIYGTGAGTVRFMPQARASLSRCRAHWKVLIYTVVKINHLVHWIHVHPHHKPKVIHVEHLWRYMEKIHLSDFLPPLLTIKETLSNRFLQDEDYTEEDHMASQGVSGSP